MERAAKEKGREEVGRALMTATVERKRPAEGDVREEARWTWKGKGYRGPVEDGGDVELAGLSAALKKDAHGAHWDRTGEARA